MKALVAGGAGFVGANLCRRLVREGWDVVAVDDLSTGLRSNLSDLDGHEQFAFLRRDVSQHDWPDDDRRLGELDVVFHLASPASPVAYQAHPVETLRANSVGTAHLIELALRTDAHLIYASTSEVYGDPLEHPQSETYWGNVNPIGPRSMYDEGKRFGEALITAERNVHGLRATICRLFNTYGPGMRLDDGRVIPEFITATLDGDPIKVHAPGTQTRSFMFVDDLLDALVMIAQGDTPEGIVVNIGNPAEITMEDLARTIGGPSGRVEIVPGRLEDPERRCPDISLMSSFGWSPRVELRTGLHSTMFWAQAQRLALQPGGVYGRYVPA